MPDSAIVERTEVSQILEGLCARNIAGDIQYGLNSERIKTARFRFLLLESDAICIDQPNNIEEEVTLKSGQPITVFFTHENDRWSFESRVEKLRRIVRLNEKKRIVGVSLALPRELKVQQRRRDYRVAIASLGRVCRMAAESETSPYACDPGAKVYDCSMRDISSRGMAIVFYPDGPLQTNYGRRLFLEFDLDDGHGLRVCVAELRHAKTIGADQKQLWGLRLLETPSVDFTELQAELAHFGANEQRRKLRRRR